MAIDPVCGMSVDENAKEVYKSKYGGQSFNFCSQDCKDEFEKTPEQYARRSA